MDGDDEALQIQADYQLACERVRAREAERMRESEAANDDDSRPALVRRGPTTRGVATARTVEAKTAGITAGTAAASSSSAV